ncbi:hypothetical protein HMPREF1981_02071 [Bacteroides pyogenes F0041]|uniref:Uncharacterized protein n=1 Tax=Bacteroides pyogenes F0041 TaxID=1321819 RepID=U2C3Z9_9BACE|nr:hypothetical protein [Bacteroides pyogenes]ERI85184.1 hypothetical protein HMPREF1981_02071 [Bacteroides pyogenes F0041]MBB3894424.1 hypothetical protein [Bacteroides pyogenes]
MNYKKDMNRFKIGEKMYPEEWDCMSMQDIVVKHYGAKAMQLIESVL